MHFSLRAYYTHSSAFLVPLYEHNLCLPHIFVLVVLFFATEKAHAALSLIPSSGSLGGCNFTEGLIDPPCIIVYIRYLINLAYQLVGAFFALMVLLAGYQIALGSTTGDKEGGKRKLRNAIIGFIVAGTSYLVVVYLINALCAGSC